MEVWGGNQVVDSGVVMAGLDAWVYCRPFGEADSKGGVAADAVAGTAGPGAGGGDVYYVSSCATGRITRLLVADVSGHGAAVCDVAGQLRGLMRRYVNFLDQTRMVESMNGAFAANSQRGCFATAVVTTFFAPTNQLTISNAGHPPPLLYRADAGEWSYVERARKPAADAGADRRAGSRPVDDASLANIPLGIIDETHYDQFDVRLRVGDLVLCYTDSLPESPGPGGELLGQAGLLRVVRSLDVADPTTLIPRLLDAVAAAGGTPSVQADDVTVLLFRPNGLAPGVPWRDRLLAPVRVLRGVVESWVRPGAGPAPMPDLTLANVGGALFPFLERLWRR